MYELFAKISPLIPVFIALVAQALILNLMQDRRLGRVVSLGVMFVVGAVFYDIGQMHMTVNDRYSFLGDLTDYEARITLYRVLGLILMPCSIIELIYHIHKDNLQDHESAMEKASQKPQMIPSGQRIIRC